jgi:hypothetical protein
MPAALPTALVTGFGLGLVVAAQVGPIWLLCARSVLRGRLLTGLAIGAGASVPAACASPTLSGLGILGLGGLLSWRAARHD